MEKNFSNRIAETYKASFPSGRGYNNVVFLALRDEIKEAIKDGWSLKVVWKQLKQEDKIKCSYTTFLNHVRRLRQ